ncbi:MAG: cytochrome c [Candidatus Sumerlaeaceae bacterium]|nr:cytochrome c [Candidatus Sumerlaeaceae bacterium]
MSRSRGHFAWIGGVLLLVAAASVLGGCRQKMADQPYYQPLSKQKSEIFADNRSSRPLVEHTVARGHLRDGSLLYTGRVNGQFAEVFPFPVTREVLRRGQERYNIFCAPCHGQTGLGNGMIVQRGHAPAASYHDDRLVTAPVGYFFDVITNGFGRMYAYNAQIAPEDRWAIVAYVRALQYSRRATLEDVPEAERVKLTAQAQAADAAPGAAGGGH